MIIQSRETFYSKYGKRALDFVLALMALIITFPINLLIAIITFFDVGTPILFKQVRIGKNQREFYIYKFRNMTNEKDANGELLPPEQRVTRWGKFVRKTSLDELLNFVSILQGNMSFIGPRPLIAAYTERLDNRHLSMYNVHPGLECPFHEALDHTPAWQDRLDNYAWYAQNVSFSTDIKMVIRMFSLVFSRESTAKRSVSQSGAFLGYDEEGMVIDSTAVPEKYVNMYLDNHSFKSVEEAVANRYVQHGNYPDKKDDKNQAA
ncbi:MAG: sugar transferase [Clostridia bacterium]|nr:sugar transferase [Clostridia bacterium]